MRRTIGFLVALVGFFTFSSAQPIWGPDIQLTDYPNGTAYHPKIAACQDTLHVVWYQQWSDTIFHEEVMYKRSTDCGQTWTSDTCLSLIFPGGSVMPVIAVSRSVVHAAWFKPTGMVDTTFYIRSTDSGRSWSIPVKLSPGFVCDMGVSGDTVLVYWGTTTATYLSMSTNDGLTWLPARQLPRGRASILDRMAMNWPCLHIVCEQDTAIIPIPEIYHQRSSDEGQTWSQPAMVSERDLFGGQWPEALADRFNNPHVVWFDYKYSPYAWTGDIFYRTSLDTGNSWEPIDSLTVEHRATASDIMGLGDTLHLVWQDERFNPARRYSEIYYRFSSDRGATWGPETRLTYDSLDSRTPQLAVSPSGVYLVWGDNRGNPPGGYEVYFKRGTYGTGVEGNQKTLSSFEDFKVFPNPSRGPVCLSGSGVSEARIFDVSGRLIRGLTPMRGSESRKQKTAFSWNGKDARGKEVKSGVYFIRMISGKESVTKKVVILKGGLP